ncbi:uncharacterized protein isoform X3 [Castor canadensis]|uniref:Uncharacterized protein isoform X3 n=1 Tax=Castor canadensis TaxID=51338 RepID=A0AC58NEC1_CASCN
MATYPPRRLLGARPLPSDLRRDPRRAGFSQGGSGGSPAPPVPVPALVETNRGPATALPRICPEYSSTMGSSDPPASVSQIAGNTGWTTVPRKKIFLKEADHISALSAGYLALPLRALEGDWKDQEGRRNRLHPICFQFLRASLPQILFTEVVAATGLFCSNN